MVETILQLTKEGNKLSIETQKNKTQKWHAWIEIHPAESSQYICTFRVDDEIVGTDIIQQYIGAEIVEKIQTQYEERHQAFGYYDIMHMTKLEYVLNTGVRVGMTIGEVYDSRCPEATRFEHTGGDEYII